MARTTGKRPTAFIMRDEWFGHRNPLTGAPMGDREEYTSWDFALLEALQTVEDFTDSKSGLPIWEVETPWVEVDAVKKVNKFQASIENATKGTERKPYKPRPGEYFVPALYSRKTDEEGNEVFWTFREWASREQDDD